MNWQPIESAPKNVSILVAYPIGHSGLVGIDVMSHFEVYDTLNEYDDPQCLWSYLNDDNDPLEYTGQPPTHWMPLPEPPKG